MPRKTLLLAFVMVCSATGQSARQWQAQGEALKAKGDAAGALASYEKAAAADPHSGEIEDQIGFLLAVLHRDPEAKTHFERATVLDPGLASAYFHLGVLYWLQKDPTHAIPLLETAVRLAPAVFDYHVKLGLSF